MVSKYQTRITVRGCACSGVQLFGSVNIFPPWAVWDLLWEIYPVWGSCILLILEY